MKALIAGGRGRVGSKVADLLESHGVEVVSGGLDDGVDYLEGTGVPKALEGVDTIINVLNTRSFDKEAAVAFFQGTTRTLSAEAERAGVKHHILLSIVGVGQGDASNIGYYFGKVAQEKAVKEGPLPYTIVRSTQFHAYIPVLADQHTVDGEVRAPRELIQPVALDELVSLLAEVALVRAPLGELKFAGPERYYMDDLLRGTLAASGDAREVVTVPSHGPVDVMVPRGEYWMGHELYPVRGIPLAD